MGVAGGRNDYHTEEAVVAGGGHDCLRPCSTSRRLSVVQGGICSAWSGWQAMPRAVAQPSESQYPQGTLDSGRRPDHPESARNARQPLVFHRQAVIRTDRQRHQESLELDYSAESSISAWEA